jgi:hypothetical protein
MNRRWAVWTIATLLLVPEPMVSKARTDPCADTSGHSVSFVPVGPGVQVEVLDWGGAGTVLVLLAGLGNSAHVFDHFAHQFTYGSQDSINGLKRAIPGARVEVLDGGHYVFVTNESDVVRISRQFLDALAKRSSRK